MICTSEVFPTFSDEDIELPDDYFSEVYHEYNEVDDPDLYFNPLQGHKHDFRNFKNEKLFTISFYVGPQFELSDITTHIEGKNLVVKGERENKVMNGSDNHCFERTYNLPENVLTNTLKVSYSINGNLLVAFDKEVQARYTEVDLSTTEEYRIRISTSGFQLQNLEAHIKENVLFIQHNNQYHKNTERTIPDEYILEIKLPPDVDPECIRISVTDHETAEIFGPRQRSKKLPDRRVQDIENQQLLST